MTRSHTLYHPFAAAVLLGACLAACGGGSSSAPASSEDAGGVEDTSAPPEDVADDTSVAEDTADALPPLGPDMIRVQVTLDGEPAADTLLVQGGTPHHWRTDADGAAVITIDREVEGQLYVVASHPEARQRGVEADFDAEAPQRIELFRFSGDNPDYVFQDPGEPGRREDTRACGHCHQTINDAWHASPHRASASNPVVQDVYAGVASAVLSEEVCQARGGRWLEGLQPGTDKPGMRCYVGAGVLPTLNDGCGGEGEPTCDTRATRHGACADCHAPAIDGQLGGRDLLEAQGIAFEYGVSCDVCHRVNAVRLDAEEPGVAGRLELRRPGERSPSLALGVYLPLTFGPSHDSPNPRMGSVQRDHFRDATLCAGCHQHDQPALAGELDRARWPDGRLPVQSTWEEWRGGPLSEASPCPSCHMPPDPEVLNGADLQRFELAEVGVQGGWKRPAGHVRRHSWLGPRQPEGRMLELAAAVFVTREVADGALTASVTVKNVGPGHALPTGEPLRSLILRVEASCDGEPLEAVGGDAVPGFGGWLDRRGAEEGWSRWPGAEVGDVIRVVRRPGGFYNYSGFGPFGDGRFDPEARGMPIEEVAGSATVTEVGADGEVTLDRPLPEGEVAYRVRPEREGEVQAYAGSPGFAFARVMANAAGDVMVPHFAAVDVVSDNRLLPQQSWTSTHRFAATCEAPRVRAALLYRPYPLALVEERGWQARDTLMMEVER